MKKIKWYYLLICLIIGGLIGFSLAYTPQEKKLPLPEATGGARGMLGIDKNINEETIDQYLNRKDSVYRDMRMLIDHGNYEAIGGDSYLSGFVEGFEAHVSDTHNVIGIGGSCHLELAAHVRHGISNQRRVGLQ